MNGAPEVGSVLVNEVEVDIDPNQNLIQAAEQAGFEVPHYCWHHELSVVASCRMCLVEVGETKPDGTVAMMPKLVPACQTPCKPGTVVKTNTPKVKAAQQQTLEFLLLNHPLDCPICDQAGECYLQDYTYKFGKAHSRLNEPKVQREDKYHIGDQIALFTDRCVMCTRCVRFTREVSGTAELQVINRGSLEEIDVFPGHACNNKLAGNVVDLCPVGALCSKDFLYKKRVWWLKSADSVCTGCSTGCSIEVDQNDNIVQRLRPRDNPQAQGAFMCDDGRFGWKYIHADSRLTAPRIGRKTGTTPNPKPVSTASTNGDENAFQDGWSPVLEGLRAALRDFSKRAGKKFLTVLSPFMTCEEAYLLCSYLRSVDKQYVLALGPIPTIGEDDLYPKGPRGEAPAADKVRFTIRAEKCPNRRGVEAVIEHFQNRVIYAAEWTEHLAKGDYEGAYVVGGYPQDFLDDSTVKQLGGLDLLIVQDIRQSSLSDGADFVLAAGSFAEREGTVINHSGLAQLMRVAIRPAGDAWSDGRILMELSGRKGLFHSQSIREEMAKHISKLAKFGQGEIGPEGVQVL
jgi:NADH-quinone oxidoreductase subunit G